MSSDRETDILKKLIDQWKDPESTDLRDEAAKEINDLRRACRAMAREILRLKDPAQASTLASGNRVAA